MEKLFIVSFLCLMAEINAGKRAELCNFITQYLQSHPCQWRNVNVQLKVLLGYRFAVVCGNELEVNLMSVNFEVHTAHC